VRWQVYGGLAGEPALGPVAFPHRTSAMSNPISPIAHHWLDATHVSFGVITTGIYARRWKAEASVFNGREPDENRTDLDLGPLDSVAARFSVMPAPSLVMQVSAGHLHGAEQPTVNAPRVDVDRMTASAIYHRRFSQRNLWATTVAWGANRELGVITYGLTTETSIMLSDRHVLFGRAEMNGKPAHDLHIHESHDVFTVGKLQAGYTQYLKTRHGVSPGLGGGVSAALVPVELQPRYGDVGLGVQLFLTLRPAEHQMGAADANGRPQMVMVQTAFDPSKLTCASPVTAETAARATYEGRTYYFCSTADRDRFMMDPKMSLSMMPPKE
jgi:YHS domain-containing protein